MGFPLGKSFYDEWDFLPPRRTKKRRASYRRRKWAAVNNLPVIPRNMSIIVIIKFLYLHIYHVFDCNFIRRQFHYIFNIHRYKWYNIIHNNFYIFHTVSKIWPNFDKFDLGISDNTYLVAIFYPPSTSIYHNSTI